MARKERSPKWRTLQLLAVTSNCLTMTSRVFSSGGARCRSRCRHKSILLLAWIVLAPLWKNPTKTSSSLTCSNQNQRLRHQTLMQHEDLVRLWSVLKATMTYQSVRLANHLQRAWSSTKPHRQMTEKIATRENACHKCEVPSTFN